MEEVVGRIGILNPIQVVSLTLPIMMKPVKNYMVVAREVISSDGMILQVVVPVGIP